MQARNSVNDNKRKPITQMVLSTMRLTPKSGSYVATHGHGFNAAGTDIIRGSYKPA